MVPSAGSRGWGFRINSQFPVRLFCFPTLGTPTGLIGQLSPHLAMIEWPFLSHQPQSTITTYITALCHLIIKECEWTQQLFVYDPAFIHIPLTQVYSQQLPAQSLEFQCAIADFVGGLEINLPSDKLLQNIPFLQIRLAEKVRPTSITGVRTMFLDRSRKTRGVAIT